MLLNYNSHPEDWKLCHESAPWIDGIFVFLVLMPIYSYRSRALPCLPMLWLLASPGHQRLWYSLTKRGYTCIYWDKFSTISTASMKRNEIYIHMFIFSLTNSVNKGLINTCAGAQFPYKDTFSRFFNFHYKAWDRLIFIMEFPVRVRRSSCNSMNVFDHQWSPNVTRTRLFITFMSMLLKILGNIRSSLFNKDAW